MVYGVRWTEHFYVQMTCISTSVSSATWTTCICIQENHIVSIFCIFRAMPNLLFQNRIKIELWVLIKREDTLAKCWKCQRFTLIFFWHMQEDIWGFPQSIPESMLEGMLESMLNMAVVPEVGSSAK